MDNLMDEFSFSLEEIKALLDEIEKEVPIDSFLYLRPSEFQNIADENVRHQLKKRYQIAKKYYLGPLETLLISRGNQIGKYLIPYRPESDLTITEQISRARIALNKQGFSNEQLLASVPKTVNELKSLIPEEKELEENRAR